MSKLIIFSARPYTIMLIVTRQDKYEYEEEKTDEETGEEDKLYPDGGAVR